MQPYRILLASVLKPVDDIRIARKIGLSLARHTGAEVHVAGFCAATPTQLPPLVLHPLFCFGRISLGRALANARLFNLAWRLKPRLLIVSTHELLLAASLLKLLLKTKVVYDVQENYYRNIRFTPAFPAKIRFPLAAFVRTLEYATRPLVDHYLLAEKAYARELRFVRHKATVIENKALPQDFQQAARQVPVKLPQAGPIELLYSGTFAPTYGVMEAIRFAGHLHALDSRYRLHLIGFAPQPQVLLQLKAAIAGKPYITLTGGQVLVPHNQIEQAISKAHVALMPYQKNPSIDHCIPTKLYEYLANALPVLLPPNPYWESLTQCWDAGLATNFTETDTARVHEQVTSQAFYKNGRPTGVTWETEESKLINALTKKGL